jgi:hypothetical protein
LGLGRSPDLDADFPPLDAPPLDAPPFEGAPFDDLIGAIVFVDMLRMLMERVASREFPGGFGQNKRLPRYWGAGGERRD